LKIKEFYFNNKQVITKRHKKSEKCTNKTKEMTE